MFIIQLTKVNIIDSQRRNYILLSLHAKLGHCDSCHETLTSYSRNQKYCASIHAAVRLTKKTLNHYYELTDKSEVYHIAMGVCFLLAFLLPSLIT
jgi:hypothetical protein